MLDKAFRRAADFARLRPRHFLNGKPAFIEAAGL